MPRINPELRARQCQFTYSDGRRCRLARTATGEGYCYSHARKIREQRELECLLDYLTQPLAHPAIASTSITHVLVRLFGIVAGGRLPAKTSNALLRIAQTLHRTLPSTKHEFGQVFDDRGLRATVRTLYDEQEHYINLRNDDPEPLDQPSDTPAPAAVNTPAAPNSSPAPTATPEQSPTAPSRTTPQSQPVPTQRPASSFPQAPNLDLSAFARSHSPNPTREMSPDEFFLHLDKIFPATQSPVPK